jgi:hypothetical protein
MNKDTVIIARITKEEKKMIISKAKANGMKLSEFIRYAVLTINELEVNITTTVKEKR